MNNIVEQICIIRAVEDNGSNLTLSLEPKKQKCKGCDGKCAKMLKPEQLIEVPTNLKDLSVGEEVMLYMDKKYLRNLVFGILGIPLFALLVIVVLGSVLNFSELQIILAIFMTLISIFILQVKYFENKQQLRVEKVNKD
tara:strand:+ start:303 stop:719 length:417 start_codon:yes stop_codon:yes gene_type:complete